MPLLTAPPRGLHRAGDEPRGPCTWASRNTRIDPAGRVEATGITPHADEHLLHDFFAQRPIAEHAAGEAEARARVPAVQLGERLLITHTDNNSKRRT